MKTIEIQLPDQLADELDALVSQGWFASESEVVRLAVLEYIRNNRFALAERFQREDITWALTQREQRG